MNFEQTKLKGVYVIQPKIHQDNRGIFYRLFCSKEFKQIGLERPIAQSNTSINNSKGTLRGMHFQKSPSIENKIVTCTQGAAFDVIVDLRKNSSTFLHWVSVELNAETRKSVFIPVGCAHGFLTLKDNTHLVYHHSDFYQAEHEGAFKYDDPLINIQWPFEPEIISDRDLHHNYLDKNFKGFEYEM